MKRLLALVLMLGVALTGAAFAQSSEYIASLRGEVPLDEQASAPRIARVINTDKRRQRNYPEQPPTIPHSITGYQVDLNANKCLTCHARKYTGESQAPMVSITHFMDRDGQFLATVSARRYFCNQCHVVEHDARLLIANDFVDIDTVVADQ